MLCSGAQEHGVLLSKPSCANAALTCADRLPALGECSIAFHAVPGDVHDNHWKLWGVRVRRCHTAAWQACRAACRATQACTTSRRRTPTWRPTASTRPTSAACTLALPHTRRRAPGHACALVACRFCALKLLVMCRAPGNDSRGVGHMPYAFRRPTCPGIHVQEVMAPAAICYFQRCAYINGFLPDGRCGGQQGGVGRLP